MHKNKHCGYIKLYIIGVGRKSKVHDINQQSAHTQSAIPFWRFTQTSVKNDKLPTMDQIAKNNGVLGRELFRWAE